MAMERVTVEQNGERFTLEVPEGTTDDQVRAFLTQQQSGAVGGDLTTPESAGPNPAENAAIYAAQAATPAAIGTTAGLGKAILNAPVTALTAPITSPISTARNVAGAIERLVPQVPVQQALPAGSLVQSMPTSRAMNIGELLKAGGRGIGSALVAPESAFTLPYNMAAYEQAKIRQNPTAPGLEYNPYAQTVRGEAATQGQAGAANQMRTVVNQPYGNVNSQERAMLDEDARMKNAIRKKAFQKVMGPVVPGSF
jgi:hypothetical protein